MEIRRHGNTYKLGESLYADRKTKGKGSRVSYRRVLDVQPGDYIIHWINKMFLGFSIVGDDPISSKGRAQATLRVFQYFPVKITLEDLRRRTESVLSAYNATRPIEEFSHFPFQINHPNLPECTIRGASTTYLTRFPPQLIRTIPGLDEQIILLTQEPVSNYQAQIDSGKNNQWDQDPQRRKAVEKYAEELAISHFEQKGYELLDRPGKPYDLQLVRNGEELHVEVKGSSTFINTVTLTRNEVIHAEEEKTSLYVVDDITVDITESGYECSAGRERHWNSWTPNHAALTPLEFAYQLPMAR